MPNRDLKQREAIVKAKQAARGDGAPAFLYRKDLLNMAKHRRYGLGFREIAARLDLSTSTVTQAFDGHATKIETLWKLADFFDVDWLALFDVKQQLVVDRDCRITGTHPERFPKAAVTPEKASRTRKAKHEDID